MSLIDILTSSSSDELRDKFKTLERLLNDDRDPEKLMKAIGSFIVADDSAVSDELKKVAGLADEEMSMIAACAQTAVEFRSLEDLDYWEVMAQSAATHFCQMICERLLLVLHRPEFGRAREVNKPENKAVVEFTFGLARRLIDSVPRTGFSYNDGFVRLVAARNKQIADLSNFDINIDISAVINQQTHGLLLGNVLGDHLVIAGGAVRDSMVGKNLNDVDIWFVGVRDQTHAVTVMRCAVERILENAETTRASHVRLVLTPSVVTLEVHYNVGRQAVVKFQFIKRLFLTVMQVLLSFDQDSAKFAMDGTFTVFGTVNAMSSLTGRYAIVNPLMKTSSRRYGDQASKKNSDVFAPNCKSVLASCASVHQRIMLLPMQSGLNSLLMDIVRTDSVAGIVAVGILMGKRDSAKWVDNRSGYGATHHFDIRGYNASPVDGLQGLFPDNDDGLMEAEFYSFFDLMVNNPASRMCVSGHECDGIKNFLRPVSL